MRRHHDDALACATLLSFLTRRPHSWRLTASARLEAGMRARCAPGVIHGVHRRVIAMHTMEAPTIAAAATLSACWGAVGGGRRGRGARSCQRCRPPLRAHGAKTLPLNTANSKWSKVDVVALRRRRLRARRRLACSSRWAVCTATSSSAAVRRLPQHRAPSTARMRRPPLLPPPNCLHGHLPVAAPEDDALLSADDHVQELLLALT